MTTSLPAGVYSRVSAFLALVAASTFAMTGAGAVNAACTPGDRLVQVPEECGTLADAVAALADGGTIDVAAGLYTFGTGGLNLSGKNKRMTIAARTTGGVVFSGQSLYPVARINNSSTNGKPITFEGIRFESGFSSAGFQAGGLTLRNAEVSLIDCAFAGNRNDHESTGGGALGLYGGSRALVARTSFTDNRAENQGGAVYVYTSPTDGPSSLWVQGSSFERNTTAEAGFTPTAAGGAIYGRNARLYVTDSRFSENRAGWVAGAIYLWGDMGANSPFCNYSAPSADLVLSRSSFEDNVADDSMGEASVPQTFGGAVHAERCVRVRIFGSSFERNSADWGGALSSDHARFEISQSLFRHNFATAPAPGESLAIGGTIAATSTDFGSDDFPNGALIIDRTLIQGRRFGDLSAPNAQNGGCIEALGDGSKPIPVPSSARLAVTIVDSILFECAIDLYPGAPVFVVGGAIDLDRAALALTNVLFARVRAVATPPQYVGVGSGISARTDSRVTFSGTVAFSGGETDGSDGDVFLSADSSTTGTYASWSATQGAPAGGLLVAAPSRPTIDAATTIAATLGWGFAGSAATLDGEPLPLDPRNGLDEAIEGNHALEVAALGACSPCAQSVAAPVFPWTSLDASPRAIASGSTATLGWTTPAGTLLAALVDHGVGETSATGSTSVAPPASTTYRRFVVAAEGGALAERRVWVDEAPPPGSLLFASGFESGLAGWQVGS